MKSMSRSSMLLAFTVAIITAAFLSTAPVCAQDEILPESPPSEAPIAEEDPQVEEPIAEELPPALEGIAQAGVILASEIGEPLPLATAEAAETLAGSDPWYKVGTLTYHFLSGVFPNTCANLYPLEVYPYCQEDPHPIQAAINYLPTSGLPSDGFLYIESGTYTDYPTINGLGDPLYNSLKGLIGTVVDYVPQVNLTGDIRVNNVDLGFTIRGFNITASADDPSAGISISDSSGTIKIEDVAVDNSGTGPGIKISNHGGTVSFNRVKASGNTNGGAWIENLAGTNGVTITGSSFDFNNMHDTLSLGGLSITTNGAVMIDGITASHNTGTMPGAYIIQCGALTVKNSAFAENAAHGLANNQDNLPTGVITLTHVYASKNLAGLWLFTKGNFNLAEVHADGNAFQGATLDTCYENMTGVCTWLGSGKVTIKDSTFNSNGSMSYGLSVEARGSISLTNVMANDNTNATHNPFGAKLSTHFSQLTSAVTVSHGTFIGNDGNGLQILAKGSITLDDVYTGFDRANNRYANNGMYGAELDNRFGTGSVTIKNSYFGYSGYLDVYDGLRVLSNGAIGFSNSRAVSSYGYGAYFDNTGGTYGVTISQLNFSYNDKGGLYVRSNGAIKLTDIFAYSNIGDTAIGVDLSNEGSSTSPGVTITNGQFYLNEATGLLIRSRGNIILTNTSSHDNNTFAGAFGADLDNTAGTGYVKISNQKSGDDDMKPGFNINRAQGIKIHTNGTVTLTNVNALNNQQEGISILLDSNKGVTMNNCRVDGNAASSGTAGILIATIGPVVINGGHANGNLARGLQVDSSSALDTAVKPVTISNFTANNNLDYGMNVLSKGAISLTNVTANNTTGADLAGINLDNHWLTAGVTLSKVYASDNIGAGIFISTNGSLIYKVGDVMSNGGDGVEFPCGDPLIIPKAVSLSYLNLDGNGGAGMDVINKGSITLTEVDARNNSGGNGVYLDNTACTTLTPCPVSLLVPSGEYNSFNDNLLGGLGIRTYGAVIMNTVTAFGNGALGAMVNNSDADESLPANVTIKGGMFNINDLEGLYVASGGNIYINGIEACENGRAAIADGVGLNNTANTSGAKGVTVIKSKFNDNSGGGLGIASYGAIVVDTNEALRNLGGSGVSVGNDYPTMKPVSILSTYGTNNFSDNSTDNLVIDSRGSVIISKVTADSSASGWGIKVVNFTGAGTVSMSKVTTRYNFEGGTYIDTMASVKIANIISMFNGSSSTTYDGLYINTHNIYTLKVTITTGLITSNLGSGIHMNLAPSKPYTLSGVYFFGNDTDISGEPDLWIE